MILFYNALFIGFLLWRGGPYVSARPRPRFVLIEVAIVFALGFLANAWRNYLFGQHSPEPATSVSMWTLTVVSFAGPLTPQLLRRRPFSELGIALNVSWRVVLIVGIWVGVLVVAALIFRANQRLPMTPNPTRIATFGFGLLGEELLYRGFLQTRLETVFGPSRGWIPASLLFGLTHIAVIFVSGPVAGFNAAVQAAVVGALWGIAFAKSRSLIVTWPAHVVYDLVPGGLLFR